ncbi:MAG: hypothetical protein HOO06_11075 [Bdellovibrionaceae bacterium]|nr:hypothetical protein [Pseudobdellovibrionaceae bacterium]
MKEEKSNHHVYLSIYRSNGTMPLDCGARGGQPRFLRMEKISYEESTHQIKI